jgi:hypothetical protein
MSIVDKLKKIQDSLLVLICSVVTFFFNRNLIIQNPILTRDDFLFVEEAVINNTFEKYVSSLINFRLQDVQPLRDLTFYIDHYLSTYFFQSHHFTNSIIAVLVLIQISKILKNLIPNSFTTRAVIIILFTVHPVFVMSTAWVSARKHLMAFGFILAMFNQFFEKKPSHFKICSYFLFSLMSQPIFGLAPIFIYLNNDSLKKISKKCFGVLISTSVLFIILNVLFYSYKADTLNTHYVHNFDLSIRISSLGRSFVQIFLPFSQAAEYDRSSYLSFVGFGIISVFLIILYKKLRFKVVFLYIAICALTLYPTLQYFTKESYLLMPCLATLYILVILAQKLSLKIRSVALGAFFLLFFFSSFLNIDMWESDIKLWKKSFENEGGVFSSIFYARYLINTQPQKAEEIIGHVLENYKLHFLNIDFIIAASIVYNRQYTNDQKLRKLRENLLKYPRIDSYITRFYIALVFFDRKDPDFCFDIFRKDFKKYTDKNNPIMGIMHERISFACKSYSDEICGRLNEFSF